MRHIIFILIFTLTLLLVGCEETKQLLGMDNQSRSDKPIEKPTINTSKNISNVSNKTSPINVSPTINCIDTDGGVNYTVKGIVSLTKDGVITNYTEYCRHGSYEDHVMEYSCSSAGLVSYTYRCHKGCNGNGACW